MSYDDWLEAPYQPSHWTTCTICGDEEYWFGRPPEDHPLCAVCEGKDDDE